ncbi:MAG: indolepyruvate oxidoreductase subunit beta [Deltaproteobacteria bacterium]|nr:indolepyruvate oxidoreductase subunit beta [Deltaproteobacteria bacterium]MBW2048248.1 indolepyruvate oxidoreductase subunit beta [Deltaproteobacteria bacterium]MBW2111346.1 indolepyruvate oxidoreductase subunit beta [Deltaproteobacteria bacterium]MBW2352888.1 indolepyruvate oxidoreductase subunit beta [Deltaproteobacteria bacterium]
MTFHRDPFNVIIGGVGGQGNVIASQVIGRILLQKGYVVTIGETYGASQRGGAVMSHLRISARDQFSPLIPEGRCDLLMALEPVEGLRILGQYGNPEVVSLVNTRPIHPIEMVSGQTPYPEVEEVIQRIGDLSREVWSLNATEAALEMGDPIFSNMVMLGALSSLEILQIDRQGFEEAVEGLLGRSRLDRNMEAFDRGKRAVRKR